jgi:hypothetical protein
LPTASEAGLLLLVTLGAILVHGYHPDTEDAAIYVPGILKRLDPSLFPRNSEFFQSHAGLSLFSSLVAGSARLTGLPLSVVLLFWHVATTFLMLVACFRVARHCFPTARHAFAGVGLVAALLPMAASGSALCLMDPYLTTRSLSTPLGLFAVGSALGGGLLSATLFVLAMVPIHPQMAGFTAAYVALLGLGVGGRRAALALLPAPVTPAYRAVLETRPYFFITNWAWYEWLGVFAPAALLLFFAALARRRGLDVLASACRALVAFEAVFLALACVLSVPGPLEALARLQPMRCLHPLYILMFLFGGGLAADLLGNRPLRWALLFLPLAGGAFVAARLMLPATPHLELPGRSSPNPWVQAFSWVRDHTPRDAFFALDPEHMDRPGEDRHGFRAIAERSMLADSVKDSGAASMFPEIAGDWLEQTDAERGFRSYGVADLERLKRDYGVTHVVLEQPGVPGLPCPYENARVRVCSLP